MGLIAKIFSGGQETALVSKPRASSSFLRGGDSPFVWGWQTPALREPQDDVVEAWEEAASKAIDSLHNSGWLAGGVEQAVAIINGDSLRLNYRPDPRALGMEPRAAKLWARDVERRFDAWAANPYSCDAYGKQPLGQQVAGALKHWFGTGEILATFPTKRRPSNTHTTKVMIHPAARLLNNSNSIENVVQGVKMDALGAPIAYRFRPKPNGNFTALGYVEVPARDRWGRRIVLHVFDGHPSQVRGMTPLAPALQVVRQFDQLSNATLTAALIQAIFAATIESDAPTEQVLEALQSGEEAEENAAPPSPWASFMSKRLGWYKSTKVDLGKFGKLVHLFPGEKLNFHRSEHPNSTYGDFVKILLREIARCLGITYEQLTGDYSNATYSSLQAAGADSYAIALYRRKMLAAPIYQAAFEAWLEEDIEQGRTVLPGGIDQFYEERDGITRADWRGPPKPVADDLKRAKANEIDLRNRVITREIWAAEKGHDVEDIDEQTADEIEAAEEVGAADPRLLPAPGSPGGAPAETPDEDPEAPKEED
ncbi:phage portal protein [Microvirga sp. Mcv34]|uniref:phage portal protein n=1 Tax=Microvirga sp. Mcv34 TaxID=2926016 RepID=UPI0021C89F85|nr:phage portal protein [Microvirga sp. Mcv34]